MSGRGKILVGLSLVLVLTVFQFLTIRDGHNWGGDFAMYIHHSINIVEGKAYADTGYIENPAAHNFGPSSYPIGFPLLLSPAVALGGLHYPTLKVVTTTCLLLALGAIAIVFAGDLSFREGLIFVAIFGFNPYLWTARNDVVSDVPFLLFCYLALFLLQKAFDREGRGGLALTLAAAFAMSWAILIRSAGMALVPAVVLYDLVRYRRVGWKTLLIIAVFFGSQVLQSVVVGARVNYQEQLVIEPVLHLLTAVKYLKSFGLFWKNGYSQAVNGVVHLVFSLAALGYLVARKRDVRFHDVFFLCYYFVIAVWPIHLSIQGVLPLLPIFVFYSLKGLAMAKPLRGGRALYAAAIAAVFLSYAGKYTTENYGPDRSGPEGADAQGLFAYIEEHTGEEDVFLFFKPRVLSLYTGRAAAGWSNALEHEGLWAFAERIGADYLVTNEGDEDVGDFVRRNRSRFSDVYSNAGFRLLHIEGGAAADLSPDHAL